MSHNIETMFATTNGDERKIPWHYEMTKDVTKLIQEAPNSFEALKLAGLDWEVEPKKISVLGENTAIPNAIANVRTSDNKVLGIVADRYKIVQNVDAFAFTDTLIGGDVRYETAGSLNGGRKIWLLAKMPMAKVIDDDVEPYLCFTNTHDGTGAVRVSMTPVRVVCNNTLNFALSTAKRSWSVTHTGDINRKILEARQCLELAERYMNKLDEYANRLVDIKIDEEKLNSALDKLFSVEETDSKAKKEHAQNNKDKFMACYFAPDIAKFMGTAWGAVNAMTDMVAHSTPNRQTKNYSENNWGRIMNGHPLVDEFASLLVK